MDGTCPDALRDGEEHACDILPPQAGHAHDDVRHVSVVFEAWQEAGGNKFPQSLLQHLAIEGGNLAISLTQLHNLGQLCVPGLVLLSNGSEVEESILILSKLCQSFQLEVPGSVHGEIDELTLQKHLVSSLVSGAQFVNSFHPARLFASVKLSASENSGSFIVCI